MITAVNWCSDFGIHSIWVTKFTDVKQLFWWLSSDEESSQWGDDINEVNVYHMTPLESRHWWISRVWRWQKPLMTLLWYQEEAEIRRRLAVWKPAWRGNDRTGDSFIPQKSDQLAQKACRLQEDNWARIMMLEKRMRWRCGQTEVAKHGRMKRVNTSNWQLIQTKITSRYIYNFHSEATLFLYHINISAHPSLSSSGRNKLWMEISHCSVNGNEPKSLC